MKSLDNSHLDISAGSTKRELKSRSMLDSYKIKRKVNIDHEGGLGSSFDNRLIKDDYSLPKQRLVRGNSNKSLQPSSEYLKRKRMSRDEKLKTHNLGNTLNLLTGSLLGIVGSGTGPGSASARISVRSRKSISPCSNRSNKHQGIGASHSTPNPINRSAGGYGAS